MKPTIKPCPDCGELTEVRRIEVGFYYRIPAEQIRLGDHHARRCPHWRRTTQAGKR